MSEEQINIITILSASLFFGAGISGLIVWVLIILGVIE